jgi:hypothetical protein
MEQPVPYCAYLIRLWPTRRRGVTGCRVSLQCVDSGQRKDFPDLESLLTFLQVRTEQMDRIPEPSES